LLSFSLLGSVRECPRQKNGSAKRTGRHRTTQWCGLGTLISCLPWAGWTMRWNSTRRPRHWLPVTTRSWSRRPRRFAGSAGRPTRKRTTGGPCDFILRWVIGCRCNFKFFFNTFLDGVSGVLLYCTIVMWYIIAYRNTINNYQRK